MKNIKKQTWWDKKSPKEQQIILNKRKQTCLEKYGVEYTSQIPETREKIKQTWLEKYGVDNPNKNKKIIEKRIQTCLEKYGVESTNQLEIIKEKKKQTCLEKYGVKYPGQILNGIKKGKETRLQKYGNENYRNSEKHKQTCLEKYGVENPSQIKEVKDKKKKIFFKKNYINLFQSKRFKKLIIPLFSLEEYNGQKNEEGHLFYKFQCIKCNLIFESSLANGHIPRCYHCYPKDQFTKPHKIICDYLTEQNIKFEVEKYIKPYWVDIFIEPNKIIEVYGDYWHGNSKFYQKNDIITFPKKKKILVKEKWERDKKREDFLKQDNKILIIWEFDINNNWDQIQKNISEFITQ